MLRQEYSGRTSSVSLQWHHNGCDSVSNHQPHDCFLNCVFRHRSKKTSKLCVTGLCAGNSPEAGEFPAQMASKAEDVSIWWRHHDHDCQCYGSLHRQVISSLDIVHVTRNGPSQWTNYKIIMSLLRCLLWGQIMMTWSRYWSFVRGIHWSTVISPHKGQWRGALMFSLICAWIKAWVNNREAGDLRPYRAHYDVTVMVNLFLQYNWVHIGQMIEG